MLRTILHKLRVLRSRRREKKKDKERSPHWSSVRDKHLKEHSTCAACGGTEELQVHHVVPFHINKRLELSPTNLITLCMGKFDCHQLIGHGRKWTAFNPFVRKHAILVLKRPGVRPHIERAAMKSRRMAA